MSPSLRVRITGVAAVSALLFASACSAPRSSDSGDGAGDWRLGAVLSLTGGAASYGAMARGGIDLAVQEINAAGGVDGRKINIQYEDNQLQPAKAATGAQRLANDGVRMIFTHGSSITLAIAPIADQKNILLANLAAQSSAVLESKSVYSFLPTNDMELGELASMAYNKLNLKTLAIIHSDDDYGKSASAATSKAFKELGGTVVATETHPVASTDMRTQLIKIRGTNPSALAVLSNTGEIGHIIKQAKELGITAQLLAADSALSPSEPKTAGDAFNGVKGIAIYFDAERNELAKKFSADFTAKYSMAPNNYAAIAYEATKIIADGIKETKSDDPAKLGPYLLKIKDREGTLGKTSFGENRVVQFPYYEWQWDGKLSPLSTT